MRQEELDAIKARNAARTQGVWIYRPDEYDDWGSVRLDIANADGFRRVVCRASYDAEKTSAELDEYRRRKDDPSKGNGQFIAHASTDIPALIAALEASQERVKALEEALKPFADGYAMACREGVSIRDVIGLSDLRRAKTALDATP